MGIQRIGLMILLASIPILGMADDLSKVVADAPTEDRKHTAAFRAWLEERLLRQYEKAGLRSDTWDADAIAFLQDYARGWTEPHRLTTDEREATARRLLDKQCRDAAVMYVIASDFIEEGSKIGRSALQQFLWTTLGQPEDKPPLYPRYTLANGWWLHLMDRHKETNHKLAEAMVRDLCTKIGDAWVACLQAGEMNGIERRIVDWALVRDLHGNRPARKVWGETLLRIAGACGQTWYGQAVRARGHYCIAWAERGGGYANTVTDEGWLLYHEHIAKARQALEASWDAHPHVLTVAQLMQEILVGADQAERRLWLERAIRTDPSDPDSYRNYIWSLYPRWCGSWEQILTFGNECLDTKRFDTDAPWAYLLAVLAIHSDAKRPEDAVVFLQREMIEKRLDAVYGGYLARAEAKGNVAQRDRYLSHRVGLLFRSGYADRAGREAHQLGDRLQDSVLKEVGVEREAVLAAARKVMQEP